MINLILKIQIDFSKLIDCLNFVTKVVSLILLLKKMF